MDIVDTQARGINNLAAHLLKKTRPGFRLDPPDNPPKAVVVNANNNHVVRELWPSNTGPTGVDVYA